MFDASVHGDEHFESTPSPTQQLAVRKTGPAHLNNGSDLVAGDVFR